jgi:hypothetical protein
MPAILAAQEAEIRRITVQSQAQENSSRDSISKIPFTNKRGWELVQWLKVQTPVPPKERVREGGEEAAKVALGYLWILLDSHLLSASVSDLCFFFFFVTTGKVLKCMLNCWASGPCQP